LTASNVVRNGAAIAQWNDQSGNNRHATQAAYASQPMLDATATPSGLPAVTFDGVDDFLNFNLPINGLSGMTIIMVAANTQDQNGGDNQAQHAAVFWNETQDWGTVFLSPFQRSVMARFGTTQRNNQLPYQRPQSIGTAFTLTAAIKNGTTDRLYVNGQSVLSQSGKLPTIAGCQDIGNIGRGHDDDTFFAGKIAELLVFTRAISAQELATVQKYLTEKFGLSPHITEQPQDVVVIAPQPATFEVVAAGGGVLSYQWRRGGANIPGATAPTFVLNPTAVSDSGAKFDVVVTGPSGSVTSQVATLTVLARPPVADLALWFRADSGPVLASGALSSWTDQSGGGHDASQSVSSHRARLVPNALNGLPAVQFDGVDDFMTFTLPVNGLEGMTIFLVAANSQNQNGGSSQAEHAALFWNETQTWGTLYVSPFQAAVNARFGTTQAGNRILFPRSTSVGNSFTLTTALKDGNTDSIYVNRVLVLSQGGKLAKIAGCENIGNLARGFDDNTYYAGAIAELLVYFRTVTLDEQAMIEGYLTAKYDLDQDGNGGGTGGGQPGSTFDVQVVGDGETANIIRVMLINPPAGSLELERSLNLRDWSPIQTITLPNPAPQRWIQLVPAKQSQGYFRTLSR
jgi:hypothetical protein